MAGQHAFVLMAMASAVHVVEEYVYPGGFLNWFRLLFPGKTITPLQAVIINAIFLGFVFSPLFYSARDTPILSLSIAGLLLANGLLHVAGTFIVHRYSPGVVTSILAYFPAAIYALVTVSRQWKMDGRQVAYAILLGIAWQATPMLIAFRPHVTSI